MWWNAYWPIIMMIGLMCVAMMFAMHRFGVMPCCGAGRHDHRAANDDRVDAPGQPTSSAFAEYRADTLRRLENEETEFHGFLDRLRSAKDKAEFDAFMGERGTPKTAGAPLSV
jgi:hypothetical protein